MVDLKLIEPYVTNSEPIEYELKKGGILKINPIILKDYFSYNNIVETLSIEKNEFDSIDYIRMSYLEFLYNMTIIENEISLIVKNGLFLISKLCFGYDKISLQYDKNKMCLLLCNDDESIDKIIKPKEFDDIKKIILMQNNPFYDDREISQDMKKIMKDYYELKYKDVNNPTIEQKKAFVSSKVGKTFYELNKLPIREFELLYQSCVDSEIYIAQKIIQASYKYDVKQDIRHPLFDKKKDPYEEVLNGKSDLSMLSGIENVGVGLN